MTGSGLDMLARRNHLCDVDVVVAGAGVIGLAAALTARDAGLRVAVVERDARAVGATVRNFGHICTTAQAGIFRHYGDIARRTWLRLGAAGVLTVRETGTLVVAQSEEECAVLEELDSRQHGEVELLGPHAVRQYLPAATRAVGGARLRQDLRVDPRSTAARIADWLADEGVQFHWSTSVLEVEPGLVRTSRGTFSTGQVILATGHDTDYLFPQLAGERELQRCALAMLRVANPLPAPLEPAVFTGLSLLRYSAFEQCASLSAVRERLMAHSPEALAAQVNLMFTSLPDGDILLGDTHLYEQTTSPFVDARLTALLEELAGPVLGSHLAIKERWLGVYAAAPEPYLIAQPMPGVTTLAVTCGVGMTTGFGFVAESLASLNIAQPVPTGQR